MKKKSILLITIALLILLVACDTGANDITTQDPINEIVTTESAPTQAPTPAPTREPTPTPKLTEIPETAPESKSTAAPEPTLEPETTPASEPMVWIPQHGAKYHSSSTCSNMIDPSQVTLSDAIAWGYTACSKCYG